MSYFCLKPVISLRGSYFDCSPRAFRKKKPSYATDLQHVLLQNLVNGLCLTHLCSAHRPILVQENKTTLFFCPPFCPCPPSLSSFSTELLQAVTVFSPHLNTGH